MEIRVRRHNHWRVRRFLTRRHIFSFLLWFSGVDRDSSWLVGVEVVVENPTESQVVRTQVKELRFGKVISSGNFIRSYRAQELSFHFVFFCLLHSLIGKFTLLSNYLWFSFSSLDCRISCSCWSFVKYWNRKWVNPLEQTFTLALSCALYLWILIPTMFLNGIP